MSIAAAVITGLAGVTTSLISGYQQGEAIDKGADEARAQRTQDLGISERARKASEKLTRDQLRQSKRQFEANLNLSTEALDMQKGEQAKEAFRNQVSRLTGVLDKNENLKSLFINRFKGLRN